jgi:hypothetical protein
MQGFDASRMSETCGGKALQLDSLVKEEFFPGSELMHGTPSRGLSGWAINLGMFMLAYAFLSRP